MVTTGSSRDLKLELFPFISLFLCVIGVLAFLQNLLVMGEIGASEEDAVQPQIFQTAYRIDTHKDKLVLHPPEHSLAKIYESVGIEEMSVLNSIDGNRQIIRKANGIELFFGENFNEAALTLSLNEIASLNRLAKERGIDYEEYVLLNVHSGGSDGFHYISRLLAQPEFGHIRAGLDTAEASVSGEKQ